MGESAHTTVPASRTTAILIPALYVCGMPLQKHKLDQAVDAAPLSDKNILQIRKLEQVTQWVSSAHILSWFPSGFQTHLYQESREVCLKIPFLSVFVRVI